VALGHNLQEPVDVVHLDRRLLITDLWPLLRVPGNDVAARKGLREHCARLGLLAMAWADNVVEGPRKGHDHALELGHRGCVCLATDNQVLCGANAVSCRKGLHRLVVLAGLKADHARCDRAGAIAHYHALGRVRCANGEEAHVALIPPVAGAEACYLCIDHARPVPRRRGNMTLVQND